jgi:hypothetical protein
MNHPDFRIGGRVFATLDYPDKGWGMVKLTPEEQQRLVTNSPTAFKPCRGVWGQRGATNVHLASAKEPQVRAALEAAWQNASANLKKPARRQRP